MKQLNVCQQCQAIRLQTAPVCLSCGYNGTTGELEPIRVEPALRKRSILEDIGDAFAVQAERLRERRNVPARSTSPRTVTVS